MWCEGEIVGVADGIVTRGARATNLLPAGALQIKWSEDAEREEPESFAKIILHPNKWNRDVQYAWRSGGRLLSLTALLAAICRLIEVLIK
eukprot:4225443-Pleurochrysis_carterae.AAC.1